MQFLVLSFNFQNEVVHSQLGHAISLATQPIASSTVPPRRLSAIRRGLNAERKRFGEEMEDVYCSVDQIFTAEESVV